MKNRLGKFLVVAVVGVFMLTGSAMAADTIKLGVAGPHSGDLACRGEDGGQQGGSGRHGCHPSDQRRGARDDESAGAAAGG